MTEPPHDRIPLTHGKVAIVDPELFHDLNKYTWRAAKSAFCWYAVRRITIGNRTITEKMHRRIARTPLDQVCHHKNGRSLDNRLENLENMYPLEHKWHHVLYRMSKQCEG